jgi:hypothetical protein
VCACVIACACVCEKYTCAGGVFNLSWKVTVIQRESVQGQLRLPMLQPEALYTGV